MSLKWEGRKLFFSFFLLIDRNISVQIREYFFKKNVFQLQVIPRSQHSNSTGSENDLRNSILLGTTTLFVS